MPYRAKSRGDIKYHAQRYNSMIENTATALADRVASYMLAIVWSSGGYGVFGKPHEDQYSVYTSTTVSKMTKPVNLKSLPTKKERRKYSQRQTKITKISNPYSPNTHNHWLKNMQLRQLDIQLECVAAAHVGGTWFFAANTVIIIDSDVTTTLRELGTPWAKYHIVREFTPNMHAEMKILKHFRSKGIQLDDINMGVSKPCCHRCKEVLDREGVNYTSYHTNKVAENRWTAPF